MNERDVKLAALIDELVTASSQAGYIYAWYTSGVPEVTDKYLPQSKDKVDALKKKLFEALNIRIV